MQPGTRPSRQASRSLRMLTEGVRDRVQNTAFREAGELSQLKVKRQDRHCTRCEGLLATVIMTVWSRWKDRHIHQCWKECRTQKYTRFHLLKLSAFSRPNGTLLAILGSPPGPPVDVINRLYLLPVLLLFIFLFCFCL